MMKPKTDELLGLTETDNRDVSPGESPESLLASDFMSAIQSGDKRAMEKVMRVMLRYKPKD